MDDASEHEHTVCAVCMCVCVMLMHNKYKRIKIDLEGAVKYSAVSWCGLKLGDACA